MPLSSAFAASVAPNFDTGVFAPSTPINNATTAPNAVDGTNYLLIGATLDNTDTVAHTVRITNGAGVAIVPDIDVPAKTEVALEWNLRPVTGVKASADSAGVNVQVWGYQ